MHDFSQDPPGEDKNTDGLRSAFPESVDREDPVKILYVLQESDVANIKSSKKDVRRNERRKAVNRPQKTRLRSLQKKIVKLVGEGKVVEARESFQAYTTYLDRAGKRNLIHHRQADRKKSRMALLLNKAQKSGQPA